jgi:pimeloyl-ACP methyl ester carboxylesterase
MPLSLISIPTDTHALDGLYYAPDAPARGAAMLLHGNCMNFYTGAPRFLPPHLNALGLAALSFNRRGHDMVASLNSRAVSGGSFQMTKEAIADNRYAAGFLKERGFATPIVIGHSNGGMLAVQHVADHPETPALVLLSAHLGGKSIVPHASKVGLLGGDRIAEVERQARRMVAEGRGQELMVLPGWWWVITAESYLDYASELPDVLELAPRIKCPVLYIRGDKEPAHVYPAEDFAERAGGRCDVRIVKDCDHFYGGREDTISGIVTDWLQDLRLDHVLAKT